MLNFFQKNNFIIYYFFSQQIYLLAEKKEQKINHSTSQVSQSTKIKKKPHNKALSLPLFFAIFVSNFRIRRIYTKSKKIPGKSGAFCIKNISWLESPVWVKTFELVCYGRKETGTKGSINNTMVVAKRQIHHMTDSNHISIGCL